jgi:hypothetical protein
MANGIAKIADLRVSGTCALSHRTSEAKGLVTLTWLLLADTRALICGPAKPRALLSPRQDRHEDPGVDALVILSDPIPVQVQHPQTASARLPEHKTAPDCELFSRRSRTNICTLSSRSSINGSLRGTTGVVHRIKRIIARAMIHLSNQSTDHISN